MSAQNPAYYHRCYGFTVASLFKLYFGHIGSFVGDLEKFSCGEALLIVSFHFYFSMSLDATTKYDGKLSFSNTKPKFKQQSNSSTAKS